MKKFIFKSSVVLSTLILSTVFAATVPTSSTSCLTLTDNLSFAQRLVQKRDPVLTEQVLTLQKYLVSTKSPSTKRAYLSLAALRTAPGYFGVNTSLAVRTFQKDYGVLGNLLPANYKDVVVDDATIAKISEISCVSSPSAQSSSLITPANPTMASTDTVVYTSPATNITPTGAALNMFYSSASQAISTFFSWGNSTSTLTNEVAAVPVQSSPSTGQMFSGNLSNLSPNSVYFFQAKTKDTLTGTVTSGNILYFATPACTPGLNGVCAPTLTFTIKSAISSGEGLVFATSTTGSPIYLIWNSSNAYSCTASDAWSGLKATSSRGESFYPVQPLTTYTLTCEGQGGTVTKSVSVNTISSTNQPSSIKPDVTLKVIPNIVSSFPATVYVSGSALNANNCYASTYPLNSLWYGEKSVTGMTPVSIRITATTTFSFGCVNTSGINSSTTQSVTVIQVSPEVSSGLSKIIASDVTFLPNSSPIAQYLVGRSTAQLAKFNVKASGGAQAMLTDITFTVPENTISSISVNGRVASVVGTTATIYNSGIVVPAGPSGVDIPVFVTLLCADTTGGCSGVSSSIVNLTLSKLSYFDGQTTQPALVTSAKTPNHVLVVSKPTVSAPQSTSRTVSDGVSKIGEFTVVAGSEGNIELKQVPVVVSTTGGVAIVPGSTELRDRDGNAVLSGTNKLNGSGNFTFSIPRLISRGIMETYSVYTSLSGTAGPAGTQSVTFQLGDKGSFIWNDTAGGAYNLTGTLLPNYPSTSQTSIYSGSSAVCATGSTWNGTSCTPTGVLTTQVVPPTTLVFTTVGNATSTTISSGSSLTLKWYTRNAWSCEPSGAWTGLIDARATSSIGVTVRPTQSTTYTLTCIGEKGIPASASVTVNVATMSTQLIVNEPTPLVAPTKAATVVNPPAQSVITSATVPGAVNNLVITPGDKRISATFTPPTNNGGSAVTLYVLDCGTGITYGSVSSPILYVDSNFINGKTYYCSVYAINAIGSGARLGTSVTLPLPLNSILTPYASTISGGKSVYAPGESMVFSVKGTAIDGTATTPTKGFAVSMRMIDSAANTISINGVVQTKDALYDSTTGAWTASFIAPSTVGVPYRVVSTLKCLNPSLGCSNATPNPPETEKVASFTVVNPVTVQNRAVDITFSNVKPTSMDIITTLNVGIPGSTAFLVYASGTDQTISPTNCTAANKCIQTASITPTADATNKQYTFSLAGLTPNTTYRYKVYVRDPQGNLVEGSWGIQGVVTPTGVTISGCDLTVGDVNGDGKINMLDLDYVKSKSGTVTGNANYDAKADLDKSGAINSGDILRMKYLVMTCYSGPVYAYSISTLTQGQTTHTAGSIITVGASALTSKGGPALASDGFTVDIQIVSPDGNLVSVNGVAQTVFATDPGNGAWSANLSIPSAGPTIYSIEARVRCADTSKGCSVTDENGAMVPVRVSSYYKFISVAQ